METTPTILKPSNSRDTFNNFLEHLKVSNEAGPPVEIQIDKFSFRRDKVSSEIPNYILREVTGTLMPGTMTLVLGPPQCGKTSFLKTLAGVFHYKGVETPQISGRVTYNGLSPSEFHVQDLVTFVGQTDEHIPTLSVLETLEFAHACRGASDSLEWKRSSKAILNALGLETCGNTRVGNEMIRGISGGQRRRVSLGEMLTGKSSIILLDEFTTGLDTTVALDLTKKLRDMCNTLNYTLVCSLLQPPPEVYELFDNILLLNDGHVGYFGTRANCIDYFRLIGYDRPQRVDCADFIQQVTTELGKTYQNSPSDTSLVIPSTPLEFHTTFQSSNFQYKIQFEKNEKKQDIKRPCIKKKYLSQFNLVFKRQLKLVKRDKRFNKVRIGQSSIFGLIIGSLFYQMEYSLKASLSKAGLLFLTILFTSIITISNIAYTIEVRNIYIKQSYFKFYPAILYTISESIIEFFATIFQVLLFTCTSYWMCGFKNNFISYGYYYIIVFLNSICICQLFKCCGAIADTKTSGLISAATFIFIELIFSGYAVHESIFPDSVKWIYWLNPASWAYRALFQSEFSSYIPEYEIIHPNLNIRMGNYYMALMGISTNLNYLYGSIIYLLFFYFFLIFLTAISYHYIKHEKKHKKKNIKFKPFTQKERRTSVQGVAEQYPVDFTPVTLSFRHLYYTVMLVDKKAHQHSNVQLLHDIHGHFRPHTLTALMGSSGAGKSTLLDVLAGRKNSGKIRGEILINGYPLTKQDQRRFGYVEQTDLHCMKTTVEESFEFSARLRLPESAQKNSMNIIQSTIALLELGKEKLKILTELSGEQMKRVTIGVELVANPSVLFLDEPTSGLDVHAANVVMEAVKRIAAAGRTVICTIHQPSLTLFELFDDLILLQTGGKQVYCDSLGLECSDLLEYFESIPSLEKCSSTQNPATYMLEVMTQSPSVDFAKYYSESNHCEKKLKIIEKIIENQNIIQLKSSESGMNHYGGYATSLFTQFQYIMRRMIKKYWRTKEYSIGRVGVNILISLLLGFLFSSKGLIYSSDVDSQMGLVFIAPFFMGVIAVITGLPVVDAERMVYYREHSSGMYDALPYSIAFGLVEIPYIIFNSILFVTIFYNMVGLYENLNSILWFYLLFFLYTLYATYLGQFLVIALPDLRTATVVSGALNSIFSIFSGFFIHRHDIPTGWSVFYWISPLHYMLEGLMVTQYFENNNNITLGSTATGSLSPIPLEIGKYVDNVFGGSISYENRFIDLIALVAWISWLRIVHYLTQRFISHVTR